MTSTSELLLQFVELLTEDLEKLFESRSEILRALRATIAPEMP